VLVEQTARQPETGYGKRKIHSEIGRRRLRACVWRRLTKEGRLGEEIYVKKITSCMEEDCVLPPLPRRRKLERSKKKDLLPEKAKRSRKPLYFARKKMDVSPIGGREAIRGKKSNLFTF